MMFKAKKKLTLKEFDEEYGHTKLDRALSYAVYGIEKACILVCSIALGYWIIYWLNEFISNWIYKTFF